MSTVSFTKYQGAGNDFILIDDRAGLFPCNGKLIQSMCRRRLGIGADGVILLGLSDKADFRMRIFNADGLEASSCGNGLRCLILFLQDLGIRQERILIEVGKRIAKGWIEQGGPVIDLGEPGEISLGVETSLGVVHLLDTGAPHAVQFVHDISQIDLAHDGAALRGLTGANADFASIGPDGIVWARTFEKGVEAETLSCGTGAAAAALAAFRIYGLMGTIRVRFPGGDLFVREENGRILLSGPAEKVFTGTCPLLIMAPVNEWGNI